MSDSDIEVHAFDQTNDMIPATGSEQDGALSGTTTAEIEDPTGSPVAAASRGADDTSVTSASEDRGDDAAGGEDDGAQAPAAAAASAAADGRLGADDDTAPTDTVEPGPGARTASTDARTAPMAADDTTSGAGTVDGSPGSAATDRDGAPEPATLTEEPGDEVGEDYAPTADLPLPGAGAAAEDADRGEEHTYVVDEDGTATDAGPSEATYSGAPEVAAWSAGDDGRDEGSTRAESSTAPTEDASHTGRLADAYDAGPADEVGGADRPDSLQSLVADDGDEEGAAHVFDQTNGVIDGLEGDSDGTAASDSRSAGER